MSASSTLSIRLPSRLKKDLDRLAKVTARSRSWLAQDALQTYIELHEWQVEAIQEGIAQADEGRLIPHDEVVAWIKSWGTRREKERPR